MVINLVLFVLIARAIHASAVQRRQRRDSGKTSLETTSHSAELRALLAIMTVMGLAWIFGIFINTSDGTASLFLQYVFAIFASLQGFFVFIFYVVFNKRAKEEVMKTLTLSHRSQRYVSGTSSSVRPAIDGDAITSGINSKSKLVRGNSQSESFSLQNIDRGSNGQERAGSSVNGNAFTETLLPPPPPPPAVMYDSAVPNPYYEATLPGSGGRADAGVYSSANDVRYDLANTDTHGMYGSSVVYALGDGRDLYSASTKSSPSL